MHITTTTQVFSFDITNMYTNIPTQYVLQIIYNVLRNQNTPNPTVQNITTLTEVVINQNYFKYKSKKASLRECHHLLFYLKYLSRVQNNEIYQILKKHNILNYFRYIDDTLTTYD
jgi:hypothetical protein